MLKLEYVPHGIEDIVRYYGAPGQLVKDKFKVNMDWFTENVKVFHLSFPLRQSWNQQEIRAFHAHKKVGAVMADALEEIYTFYGLRMMRRHGLDSWGGIYNPRLKRRSGEPSTHAWGIAIDYCPELGPHNEPGRVPWVVVDAFLKRGFINLLDDQMHFQACEEY